MTFNKLLPTKIAKLATFYVIGLHLNISLARDETVTG